MLQDRKALLVLTDTYGGRIVYRLLLWVACVDTSEMATQGGPRNG